ncbi:MAG: B12-binding domain-containing radical SAM protein [Candidatus Hydrogenedentes bacterium]|nr:B12-binding domain-containing radical SAM protein [Candidatus Hydrogenedentota bacterium]
MAFKVTLINPALVHLTGDPYSSIPFMPTGLLYLAGYLEKKEIPVSILDGFGLAPRRLFRIDDQLSGFGLTETEIVERLDDAPLIGIGVHSGMSHEYVLRLARAIKDNYPDTILIAGGNHVSVVPQRFIEGGFDYVCIGEGEYPLEALARCLRDGTGDPRAIPGLAGPDFAAPPAPFEEDLDRFGFAALHLLPLENYWGLGMQHAPVQGRFMVLTTSRGCIYNCRFCTTPKVWGRQWRTRSAAHVADEIEHAQECHGITDVIIQDELFGCRREQAAAFAEELLRRDIQVRLSTPSGVKVETMDEETIALLHRVGLRYLVFAPESGSPRVLKNMNKPMDFDKLRRLVMFSQKLGIRLNCVFVLGFEDENDEDRRLTRNLALELTRLGVDEISLFIWSPLPGSDAFESETGWKRYEELNWTPRWRGNYRVLMGFRNRLYCAWAMTKLRYQFFGCLRSAVNILRGRYELKMEMAAGRMLRSWFRSSRRAPDTR